MSYGRPSGANEASAEQGISDRMIKALTTTAERSKSLLEDGYTVDPGAIAGVYIVTTPPKRARKVDGGGEYRQCYEVDLANRTCDCDMFQHAQQALGVGYGTCKHLQRIEAHVAEAARLAAPLFTQREAEGARASHTRSVMQEKGPLVFDKATGEIYEGPVARVSKEQRERDFD